MTSLIIKYSGVQTCSTEHERYLTEEIFKRPVFVTDYSEGDQSLLHETQRGWQDSSCDGLSGSGYGQSSVEASVRMTTTSFWKE